jgi:hypothetical protein
MLFVTNMLSLPYALTNRGVARVGQVVQPSCAAESKGHQNDYFKWEKFDLLHSANFELLRQIKFNK